MLKDRGNADKDDIENKGGDSLVEEVTTGMTGPTLQLGATLCGDVSVCAEAPTLV